MIRKAVDLYVLYTIVRRISTPFKDWKAYKLGVIDENGNYLIPKDQRTQEQKDSITPFDKLVLNLKKLLAKVPGANSKLATYTAALFLIREGHNVDSDAKAQTLTEQFIYENEGGAIPTNNISSGAVADHGNRGIGNIKHPIRRRRPLKKKRDDL